MHTHQHSVNSVYLQREVLLDTYFTGSFPTVLLLVNDGQELLPLLPSLPATVMVAGI
ncbi:hypothetical protein ACDQ55_11735 [Chitinophaga sp. 30R24]|uniref:hypothetical protein n=1 Tax=Chitinophaga sp. 30R24 TaxID=3248838 RepID=UPI003B900133